jgi:LysR family hydrogen peroxide-inducible transcriptional activator
MDIHQLRYFLAIAHSGSFSGAARECGVSQPSLSQQIAKLEKHLGQKLFHRLGKRVTLTDAGHLLLKKATTILSVLEDAEREVRDAGEAASHLTVGAIPTIAPYLLPPVLEQFVPRHPQVEVTVHEDVTQHLLEATVSGEVDLAIVALPIKDERLEVEPLLTEPLLLALPPQHALNQKKRIGLDELRDERFIILGEMHCLSEQVLAFCRAHEYWPKIGCRSAQISTIQALIATGLGVSLLPAMAREAGAQHVYRALSTPGLTRTIAVAWHRHRYHSLAEQQFLEVLRRASHAMETRLNLPPDVPGSAKSTRRASGSL